MNSFRDNEKSDFDTISTRPVQDEGFVPGYTEQLSSKIIKQTYESFSDQSLKVSSRILDLVQEESQGLPTASSDISSSIDQIMADEQAKKALYFLSFIMTRPINDLQQLYLKKIQNASDTLTLKETVYDFLVVTKLSAYSESIYKDLFEKGGDFSELKSKATVFIASMDVTIFSKIIGGDHDLL